jgi:4-hydroxy-tetrahydrodipicolinate reductase
MASVTVLGAGGRMGKAIVAALARGAAPGLTLAGAIDLWDCPDRGRDAGAAAGVEDTGVKITADLAPALGGSDVVIDFTSHFGVAGNAPRCAEAGAAMVIGTTGLSEEEQDAVRRAAESVPIVQAGNMSLGVNLLLRLVRDAAAALAEKGYDIEIVEKHHRHKKDAPSGTAWMLGRAAAEGAGRNAEDVARHGREGLTGERGDREIGFHAVRGGGIIGEHDVIFAGESEVLTLSHRAVNRDVFAVGALQAAAWVAGRAPGLYSMRDVLGLA